jgi:polar amino acid transport system substrate-binding protein
MRNTTFKKTLCILLFVFGFAVIMYADDIIVSIPLIPQIAELKDGKPTGAMVDIYKELATHYKDGKMILKTLYPFQRSINNVLSGEADFHYPLIRSNNLDLKQLPFDYVPDEIGKVSFVLYSKTDGKKLDVKNMDQYKIEVPAGHSQYFTFKTIESNDAGQSLQKLLAGRIDGYIDAQEGVDAIIKMNKYKNISRELFTYLDSCAIVAKTPKGEKTKAIVSDLIKKMKKDGSLAKYVGKVCLLPYDNWQPAKMGW